MVLTLPATEMERLLAKARARPKRDINQDVADEKEVSIKAYEPWVAFVAGEVSHANRALAEAASQLK